MSARLMQVNNIVVIVLMEKDIVIVVRQQWWYRELQQQQLCIRNQRLVLIYCVILIDISATAGSS